MNQVIQEDLEYITQQVLPWQDFAGKTVLISGANGFLPAYMVETLMYLNQKYGQKTKVIGLVRDQGRALQRFPHFDKNHDFQLLVQDVCEPVVPGERVDYIVHAASQASPKYYGIDPVGTLKANVVGTCNLLDMARQQALRSFLFFSSGEVYGELDSQYVPTPEDCYGYLDPVKVRACYAESKRMGENMCSSWHLQYGVPAKIVRPFHTYGPGMRLDDGRVYADFVADIVHGRNIQMKSDGKASRAFCYLADAVLGFFLVLLKGNNAEAYNVGNDSSEITIAELAERLVGLFPEKGLKVVEAPGVEPKGYLKSTISRNCPNISKLRGLGWEPKYSLEEGFKRTIRSFLPEPVRS